MKKLLAAIALTAVIEADSPQLPEPFVGTGGDDLAGLQKGIGRHIEDPERHAEFSLIWCQIDIGLALPLMAIDVPESGAIRDIVQNAVMGPDRLKYRLLFTAGDGSLFGDMTVFV